MPSPDIGTGRSINPGLMNAHKEARKLFFSGDHSTAAKGKILVITGADGQTLTAELADNDTQAGAAGPLYMMLSEKVASGDTPGFKSGFCKGVLHGVIEDVDTSLAALGDPVYLGDSGDWTLTKPTAAGVVRVIGHVIEVHATTGKIAFTGVPADSGNPVRRKSRVIAVKKAITASASVAFSTVDLGGNYDGAPFAVGAQGLSGGAYVLSSAWNGSGQLTVTCSDSTTGTICVLVGVDGDSL